MSENLDRAERALDAGLELAACPAYGEFGVTVSLVRCWRCEKSPSETSVGLCGSCRVAMLDESTTAPEPRDPRTVAELVWEIGGAEALARYEVARRDRRRVARFVRRLRHDAPLLWSSEPGCVMYEFPDA